jgi:hypothetical protein
LSRDGLPVERHQEAILQNLFEADDTAVERDAALDGMRKELKLKQKGDASMAEAKGLIN